MDADIAKVREALKLAIDLLAASIDRDDWPDAYERMALAKARAALSQEKADG